MEARHDSHKVRGRGLGFLDHDAERTTVGSEAEAAVIIDDLLNNRAHQKDLERLFSGDVSAVMSYFDQYRNAHEWQWTQIQSACSQLLSSDQFHFSLEVRSAIEAIVQKIDHRLLSSRRVSESAGSDEDEIFTLPGEDDEPDGPGSQVGL